jgi:hypothetical protein
MKMEEFIHICDIHKQEGLLKNSLDINFIDFIEELEEYCNKNNEHPLNPNFEKYIAKLKKSVLKNI